MGGARGNSIRIDISDDYAKKSVWPTRLENRPIDHRLAITRVDK